MSIEKWDTNVGITNGDARKIKKVSEELWRESVCSGRPLSIPVGASPLQRRGGRAAACLVRPIFYFCYCFISTFVRCIVFSCNNWVTYVFFATVIFHEWLRRRWWAFKTRLDWKQTVNGRRQKQNSDGLLLIPYIGLQKTESHRLVIPFDSKNKRKRKRKNGRHARGYITLTFAMIGIGHSAGNILRQMFRVTTWFQETVANNNVTCRKEHLSGIPGTTSASGKWSKH